MWKIIIFRKRLKYYLYILNIVIFKKKDVLVFDVKSYQMLCDFKIDFSLHRILLILKNYDILILNKSRSMYEFDYRIRDFILYK